MKVMMNDNDPIRTNCRYCIFFSREGQFYQIKLMTDEQFKFAKKNTNMYVFPVTGQLLKNLIGLQKRFSKAINQFTNEFVKE